MEQVKHNTATENRLKRYASLKVKVVFVNTQAIICQSGEYGVTGNNPIIEPEE